MRLVATILDSVLYYLQITEMVLWVQEKVGGGELKTSVVAGNSTVKFQV